MPRQATGTVRYEAGRWEARFTRANKSRTPWEPLPTIGRGPCCPTTDPKCAHRQQAEALAASMAPKVKAASAGNGSPETVADWFKRLHAAKEAKGLASVGDMRGRARKWILPGIEHRPMSSVTREDIERIVHRLDRAVAAFLKDGPGEGRLSPSTAANVWGDVSHAFDEAVRAKDPGLRVLKDNPVRDVRGPDAGADREGQILYSDEIRALLRGVPVDPGDRPVPLYRRQTYAVAIYTKTRASEEEALTKADVDLEHGTIAIAKQADRKSKGRAKTKATKTRKVRTVDIEPNLRPLVEWLVEHPQGKKGRLLHMPPPEDRAELLRRDLWTVGARRPALHVEGDPLQRSIVFHDLRDTGLVHMAVRGDHPTVLQWTAGHTDYKQTSGYVDRGRVEARRIGAPLPPLPPEVLPGIVRESSLTNRRSKKDGKNRAKAATPTGIEPVLPT